MTSGRWTTPSSRLFPQNRPRANTNAVTSPNGRLPSIAQNATRRLSRTALISSALNSMFPLCLETALSVKTGTRRRQKGGPDHARDAKLPLPTDERGDSNEGQDRILRALKLRTEGPPCEGQ